MADFKMVYPKVREKASQFSNISETLEQVVDTLTTISDSLKSNWFLGMCGGYALAAYIDSLKPQIDQMAKKCAEISQDMITATQKGEAGDEEGAEQFADKWGLA